MKLETAIEIFKDNAIPNLVEEFFPKGKCKERGKAIVLAAKLYIALQKLLNDFKETVKVKVGGLKIELLLSEQFAQKAFKLHELGGGSNIDLASVIESVFENNIDREILLAMRRKKKKEG